VNDDTGTADVSNIGARVDPAGEVSALDDKMCLMRSEITMSLLEMGVNYA